MAEKTEPRGPMSLLQKQNVIFIHPDLGIGGAERLIIDAAVGLQQLGHKVTIFTSHCDPTHCFDEARDGMSIPLQMNDVVALPRLSG
jgi:alpha-1,3/alpha-1,6-mannosyltransferase